MGALSNQQPTEPAPTPESAPETRAPQPPPVELAPSPAYAQTASSAPPPSLMPTAAAASAPATPATSASAPAQSAPSPELDMAPSAEGQGAVMTEDVETSTTGGSKPPQVRKVDQKHMD